MTERPVEQQQAATAFYAALDVDVSYYPAIWHSFKVGHLMTTDLDRICRRHGVSIADVHLMGAVRIERSGPLRATDLTQTLNVTNAVLSIRIARLQRKGLLVRRRCASDRRAHDLALTPAGMAILDASIADIARQANFVRCFRRLPEHDQQELSRIMGALHDEMDRDFIAASRGDG